MVKKATLTEDYGRLFRKLFRKIKYTFKLLAYSIQSYAFFKRLE